MRINRKSKDRKESSSSYNLHPLNILLNFEKKSSIFFLGIIDASENSTEDTGRMSHCKQHSNSEE